MKYNGRKLRHELKYWINQHDYKQLISRLGQALEYDKNVNESNEYHIRSLYFDDHYKSAYNEKEDGILLRKKYRIRIYNGSDQIIKLELKEKYDAYVAKQSTKLTLELYQKILKGTLKLGDVINDSLLLLFYTEVKMHRLRPCVIVDYVREPYVYKHGNVRITFDKKLQTVLNGHDIFEPHNHIYNVMGRHEMILEVKYDDYLPHRIKGLLKAHSHHLMSASKFMICSQAKTKYNWKEK